jgi:predicted Fe-Mo cluster-binding NifX family protein
MRIAVSSAGAGLDSEIDPRFGRCSHFVIVDSETMEFETIENPNVMAAGGAGI